MNKIELKKSKIHGDGVFAIEEILNDETIEVCPILFLDNKDIKIIDKTVLYDYYFAWDDKGCVIALGNGSLYNHSYEPNAMYKRDLKNNKLIFIALKLIKKNEEITVNYNGDPSNIEKVWFDK